MKLDEYKAKRKFNETPEPEGREKSTPARRLPIFVIQKHDASRLHYDFRLEVDGVLKSWAVPKGPSMNPADKRLAMMVEDHPFSYKDFEGIIPEGNYGAGTVIVWDNGTFELPDSSDPEEINKVVGEQIRSGEVKIKLNGHKVKGQFGLIKMQGRQENAWLLVKDRDEDAGREIEDEDLSVLSGRSLEEIAGSAGKGENSETEKQENGKTVNMKTSKIEKRKTSKLLHTTHNSKPKTHIVPMLATLVEEPFDHKDWIFEIKWDGYRAIADIQEGEVELYSRNDTSFNEHYLILVESLSKLDDMVLDGEIVVLDKNGVPDFQKLQNYRSEKRGNLVYYVFDILFYKGQDLRILPLEERKKFLHKILKNSDHIKISEFIKEKGVAFYKAAAENGLEGIIAKNKKCSYQSGLRSEDWLKIKIQKRQEAVIGGFTLPKGQRSGFGSLLVGMYEGDNLMYVGNVGTGFDTDEIDRLMKMFKPIKTSKSPFLNLNHYPGLQSWVEPKLICELKFAKWTDAKIIRHAAYLGLREDKSTKDVGFERKTSLPTKKKSKKEQFEVSHPTKVYWPKVGITKQDLINFYEEISDFILPYLKDRPESLNRFPNGVEGKGFFQKDINFDVPDFVETVNIYSESTDEEVSYMICNNIETLKYMANLGCLEINPWNSRTGSIDYPDYLIFDLDPKTSSFENVVIVANEIKKLMDEIGVKSFPKTSGKSGLHIYIPLGTKYDFEQIKIFVKLLSTILQMRNPEIISLERNPEDRQGKVYIDYLQNRKGQTTAGVYSTRPTPTATVSTPLHWDEVNKKLDPKNYTIKNMVKRLNKEGDLFKGVLSKSFDLEKVLKKLENIT